MRAKRLGHDAKYFCGAYDREKCPVGRGLVEVVPDFRPWLRWADLIVLGGNGKWMQEIDRVKAGGTPVIGGCQAAARLELDRMAGMAAFRRKGIALPPYRQCSSLKEAIAYVAKENRGFAVKVCGDVQDKSTSVVGKDAADLIWKLQQWEREGKKFPDGLMVQELVKGVEFAVGGWIGPGGFAEGWEENFEHKKLYHGDLGPNCGEAGTVMRLVRRSHLAEQVLVPFEQMIVNLGYCGNVDVNCIVDDEGTAWPLEWTVRLGWPAFNIELALHDGDPIEFLLGVAVGKPPKTRRIDEIAVGVVSVLPGYPFPGQRTEEVVGIPIHGVTPSVEPHVHLANAMMGSEPEVKDGGVSKRPCLATSGSYMLIGTGTGSTVQDARQQAYRIMRRIRTPASDWYRLDIGAKLKTQLLQLQVHGYATGMSYA